jgi:hypothetical protein
MSTKTKKYKNRRATKVSNTRNNITFAARLGSPQTIIYDALSELSADGYSLNCGGTTFMFQDSEDLLNNLGFTPVEYDDSYDQATSVRYSRNFSLVSTINLDDTIKNSKILDPDINTLYAQPILAFDKFKSATDTFYELDDQKTETIKNAEKSDKVQRYYPGKKYFKISSMITKSCRASNNKMIKLTPDKARERA